MPKQPKGYAIEPKYLYRDACSAALILIDSILFLAVWLEFVEDNNQTGHLLGLGNIGMAYLIYVGLAVYCFHSNGAFSIGVYRRMRVIASEIIGLFLTDFIEVFVSIAITGQFRFFPDFLHRYVPLFLVQAAVTGLLTYPMISVYRMKFPPLQILEVYGDYYRGEASKMNEVPFKYHIGRTMSYHEGTDAVMEAAEGFDAILINDVPAKDKSRILKRCFDSNKRVYFVPSLSDIIVRSASDLNLFDTPLFLCRNRGLSFHYRTEKRFFDIVLSCLALVVLSPLLLIVAIAIKAEDGGPVFYRQERCTLHMRCFEIIKFRSMIVDAEKDGRPHPAGEKDDRITRVGRVIRATRIDELPQLINIIRGDMSIVGPRPERVEHVELYLKEIPEFKYRYKVRGGLTGAAQVYGRYNTTALDKLKFDLMYIENASLVTDVQIIFETLKILFQKESTEGFSKEAQEKIAEGTGETERAQGYSKEAQEKITEGTGETERAEGYSKEAQEKITR